MNNIKTLTIIGNGFDLHHEIKSSFSNFQTWLIENQKKLYDEIVQLYNISDNKWWNEFEKNLGTLDIEKYADKIICKCKEKCYTNHQLIIEDEKNVFLNLLLSLKLSFKHWINELNAPNINKKVSLTTENTFFINLNYTNTLQSLYRIKDEQILHIHGKNASKLIDFIIGHNVTYPDAIRRISESIPKEADINIVSRFWTDANTSKKLVERDCQEAAINILELLKKDTGGIISENQNKFNSFQDVETINVYGFSFSEIDFPYLDEVIKVTDQNKVKWNISWYEQKDRNRIEKYMLQKGILYDKNGEQGTFKLVKLCELLLIKS